MNSLCKRLIMAFFLLLLGCTQASSTSIEFLTEIDSKQYSNLKEEINRFALNKGFSCKEEDEFNAIFCEGHTSARITVEIDDKTVRVRLSDLWEGVTISTKPQKTEHYDQLQSELLGIIKKQGFTYTAKYFDYNRRETVLK